MALYGTLLEGIRSFLMSVEIWKDVVGYEGLYWVSDLGRIKSKRRFGSSGGILKQSICPGSKYYMVGLFQNGIGKTKNVHKIIADAFLGKGERVDHIDTNRQNNLLSNLRLCTHRQNLANTGKRKTKNPSSFYKGVCKQDHGNVWVSRIKISGKLIKLGTFESEKEAARNYDKAHIIEYGEFGRTNKTLGLYDKHKDRVLVRRIKKRSVINSNGEVFESAFTASRNYGLSNGSVWYALKSGGKSAGFYWKYTDEQ